MHQLKQVLKLTRPFNYQITSLVAIIILTITGISSSMLTDIDRIQKQTDETTANKPQVLAKRDLRNQTANPIEIPELVGTIASPLIPAEVAYVIDQKSFTPLYAKSENIRTYPASSTKLVTALVALDTFDLNQILTVPATITSDAPGSSMKLIPNDQLTVNSLLHGLLINSGNDAAFTLAIHHPEGYEGFVADMNNIIATLRLTDTTFTNPIGYDEPAHFTTPHDLAIITSFALQNDTIRAIASTKETIVSSAVNPKINYALKNTNTLLPKLAGIIGGKTGWTQGAQGVLVTEVSRNNKTVVSVIMRSPQREIDTKTLIDWVYDNYRW